MNMFIDITTLKRMCENSKYKTSYSLLERALNLQDQGAWRELLHYYEKYAYHLMHSFNVPQNDQDDVFQLVFVKLSKEIQVYDRDKGRFRSWFASIVHRQCQMYWRKSLSKKAQMNAPNPSETPLDLLPTGSDLDAIVEDEWNQYMLQLVMERVRTHFNDKKLEVMELTFAGKNVEEIHELTQYTANSIYSYRAQIKQAMSAAYLQIQVELGEVS